MLEEGAEFLLSAELISRVLEVGASVKSADDKE